MTTEKLFLNQVIDDLRDKGFREVQMETGFVRVDPGANMVGFNVEYDDGKKLPFLVYCYSPGGLILGQERYRAATDVDDFFTKLMHTSWIDN